MCAQAALTPSRSGFTIGQIGGIMGHAPTLRLIKHEVVAIDDWAVALHMSRRAFTRLFRQETGMSLSAWRQQAIVVVALSRLLSGEEMVTAVAMDYGYSNSGAFSSMFRRVTGATPTD
jgi:AraC-like DNA-binding protein